METVEISSGGDAAGHHPACMGIYIKTQLLVQGYPVYEKSKEGENHFLFVGQYGEWVVAQNIKEDDLLVLKNSTKKPTPKIPPRKMWLYIHPQGDSDVPINQRWVKDDTIEVIAKEDGEITGNTYAEQFLVKCGLEKYIPSLLETGITKHQLRRIHNGIAYYPERSEQRNIFLRLGVTLEESLIMRKMLQEERGNQVTDLFFKKVPFDSEGRIATVAEVGANQEKVARLLDEWTIAFLDGGKIIGRGYEEKIQEGNFEEECGEKIIVVYIAGPQVTDLFFNKVPFDSEGRIATVGEVRANQEKVARLLDEWTIAFLYGGKIVGRGYGEKIQEGNFEEECVEKIIVVLEVEATDDASEIPVGERDYFKGIIDDELPCFPYNTATVCHGSPVTAIANFGPSGFFFTGGVGGTVRLWNTDPTIPPPHHRHAQYRGENPGIPPPYSLAPNSRKFYTPIVEFNLGNNDSIFDEKNESVVNCMSLFLSKSDILCLMVGGEFQGRESIQLIFFENVPPTNPIFGELGSFSKTCLDFAICKGDTSLLYCCQRSSSKERQQKEDKLVEIWDLTTLEKVGVLEGHKDSVTCLAISETTELGAKLWSGGRDHAVIVWDLQTKIQLQKFDLSGRVRGLSCHPTKEMAVATTDLEDNDERSHCMVSVMTADKPEVVRIDLRSGTKFQNSPLMQPRFEPNGRWFLTAGKGVSGSVPPAGPKLFTLPNQKEATCCQFIFGFNGKPLMALGYDDKVEILNFSVRALDTGYDSDSD